MIMGSAVIFGGTGFIGVFFSQYLLDQKRVEKVYLLDIESMDVKSSEFRKRRVVCDSRISFIEGDVRQPLGWLDIPEPISLIANFAAIHREPGHED